MPVQQHHCHFLNLLGATNQVPEADLAGKRSEVRIAKLQSHSSPALSMLGKPVGNACAQLLNDMGQPVSVTGVFREGSFLAE